MDRVDITVVIVNFNVRPFLDQCLQSIQKACGGLTVEIIVVDNASGDDSVEFVKGHYPDVILIENGENVGFAKANNQAFNIANGEAVLILNPDSFVQEDTLQILFDSLKSSKFIGAVGPKIIMPDGRFEPRSMRGFPTPWAAFSYLSGLASLFPRSPVFSRYLLTHRDPDREHEVDALSGSCMMVRRTLLEELDGFDGDYFMYGEDLDLCYRIRKKGYRVLYNPQTQIVHFKGESTRRSNIDKGYYFHQAMRLFVEKNLAGSVSHFARGLITLGFFFQDVEKKLAKLFQNIAVPCVDLLLLNIFALTGYWIRFGNPVFDPVIWLVISIFSVFYLASGFYFGIYGARKFSGRKALYSAVVSAIVASTFTYFFRQWAFSRFVVLWFGILMMLSMPGWRILFRNFVRKKSKSAVRSFIKRKTLIVGTDKLGRRIGDQLSCNPKSELEPVGYVDFSEDGAGKIISGIPVIGHVGELDRLIGLEGIQEVVFSTAEVPYERIIRLIQSLNNQKLNFKIIPSQNGDERDEITFLRLEFASIKSRTNTNNDIKS
ncbi:hypothetical protein CEE37_12790 [candidate division LCP-89 bacterium B3_LCP]|uniref:Glycosyltransferase 2-like domain-containing protein n=1 Tax=candidate division LCP-89 bacterium B3_LCP TaxID=2012998 RepID=A0A532UTW8_UNCL8|nr:MAG: hypothetical protein CEE37_12790 [candidate division LCP-89 bacterium B3_LCP]